MLKKLTTSSVDPTALSMTVRGFLVALVPLFIAVTGMNADYVDTLVDTAQELVFIGATIYSLILIAVGLIRKLYVGRWSHPDVQ